MTQTQYESIIDCINFGNPASANNLITAFSNLVKSLQAYELKEKAEIEKVKSKETIKK